MGVRTVIFDLDGTLIDSAPDVCGALNRILSAAGLEAHTVDEVKGYLGHGARILMEKALTYKGEAPDTRMIDTLTQQFLEDYANNPVVDSSVFPGVTEALEQLKAQGDVLAICTNKPSVTTAPVIEALNLGQYFDAIICSDQVRKRKPSGQHILDTINSVKGDHKNAVMVGDSENDIDAALDAQVPSVAVTFGYALRPHKELGANVLIDHFCELTEAIDRLLSS